MKDISDNQEDLKSKKEIILANDIALKQWIFLTCFIIFYYILCFVPDELLKDYIEISLLPDKYWLNAIPTFIFVTAAFIFLYVKAFELLKTVDNLPYKDFYYSELNINQMTKEIKYNYCEGILPDAGDLSEKVVNDVIQMDINN